MKPILTLVTLAFAQAQHPFLEKQQSRPFPLNSTTSAEDFQLEVKQAVEYSTFTGEKNCEIQMSDSITFFNCPTQGGYTKTKNLLSQEADFHFETGAKEGMNLSLLGDSYVVVKDLMKHTYQQTVSFMDVEKKEFRNFKENEYKEIEVEEFEDQLEVGLKDILSIHRVDSVAIVHEAPNKIQLVKLEKGKMTEPLVLQSITLNREVEGHVMPAQLINRDRIIAQKKEGDEWITLVFGLKKVHHEGSDHFYLTQEAPLSVPKRKWDGVQFDHGIFTLWNKQQSIYVYNELRKEKVFAFYTNTHQEFYDFGSMTHDSKLGVTTCYYITTDNKFKEEQTPKFYLNYAKFTNREGEQSTVLQKGTLLEQSKVIQGLWHKHGKTVLATESELLALKTCNWNEHYIDGECYPCKKYHFSTEPQQDSCFKCSHYTKAFRGREPGTAEDVIYQNLCQKPPKEPEEGWAGLSKGEKIGLVASLSVFAILVLVALGFMIYYSCCYEWEGDYYYDYAPRLLRQGKPQKKKKDVAIFELL